MRRREPGEGEPGFVPSRLRRFVEDDWPGPDIWARHEAWCDARQAWAEQHGEWLSDLDELLESFELVPDAPWDPDAI